MQFNLFWPLILFILTGCCITHLTTVDITALSSLITTKAISCHKCSNLTSTICGNVLQPENTENPTEECGPTAKGCVKQIVEKHDGTVAIFRECYYAKISTFLFTNLECENITRTSSYDYAYCYKCSGSLCNSGNHLDSTVSSSLSFLIFILIAILLRM